MLVLVLLCRNALTVAKPLGSRNTFTLWLPSQGGRLGGAVGGSVGDTLLMLVPAVVTAWTMAAFLLFVLDNAEEAEK